MIAGMIVHIYDSIYIDTASLPEVTLVNTTKNDDDEFCHLRITTYKLKLIRGFKIKRMIIKTFVWCIF